MTKWKFNNDIINSIVMTEGQLVANDPMDNGDGYEAISDHWTMEEDWPINEAPNTMVDYWRNDGSMTVNCVDNDINVIESPEIIIID